MDSFNCVILGDQVLEFSRAFLPALNHGICWASVEKIQCPMISQVAKVLIDVDKRFQVLANALFHPVEISQFVLRPNEWKLQNMD